MALGLGWIFPTVDEAQVWNRRASDEKNEKGERDNSYNLYFPPSAVQPQWNYSTHSYRPSPLNRGERLKILGVPLNASESQLEKTIEARKFSGGIDQPGSGGKDVLDRMFHRAMHFVLSLNFKTADRVQWKSLCEKRYSYLRDLLSELSHLPGVAWSASDFKLRDGSYVFVGHRGELLVIRASDGQFFRGSGGTSGESWIKRSWKLNYENLWPIDLDRLYCSYALVP